MERAMIGGVLNNSDVDVDDLIRGVVAELQAEGRKLVGLTQSGGNTGAPSRCLGMQVNFIGTDQQIGISQDLGELATGCCLDTSRLTEAAGLINAAMNDESELMVLSRFGKSEAVGAGLIDSASRAVASGVPVLMAISPKHVDAWRAYHGGLGVEIAAEPEAVKKWCMDAITHAP